MRCSDTHPLLLLALHSLFIHVLIRHAKATFISLSVVQESALSFATQGAKIITQMAILCTKMAIRVIIFVSCVWWRGGK